MVRTGVVTMGTHSNTFLAASLNENKKITATLDQYEVINSDDGVFIKGIVPEGKPPKFKEGFGWTYEDMLISLCNLYLKIKDLDVNERTKCVISWCKSNAYPYELYLTNISAFDNAHMNDSRYWEAVNDFDFFTFSLNDFYNDLEKLYVMNHITTNIYNITTGRQTDNIIWLDDNLSQSISGIENISETMRLSKISRFLSDKFPKLEFSYAVDNLGDLQIVPEFKSVFDVAYYIMARRRITSPMMDSDLWQDDYSICDCCKMFFVKKTYNQKYCDNFECQNERNRRKSKRAYQKKCSK